MLKITVKSEGGKKRKDSRSERNAHQILFSDGIRGAIYNNCLSVFDFYYFDFSFLFQVTNYNFEFHQTETAKVQSKDGLKLYFFFF